LYNYLNTIILSSCYDDQSCIQRVQEIQKIHQNNQGWADIGYHFLVGENGKVYEGRGWNREAAHSSGWNNDAFGKSVSVAFSFII
jgi:N-acetylmuramoyl-L-alanine amidase